MSAAEAAVKPESDKEETSESEASAAEAKPASPSASPAAAAAPVNKQEAPIAKPVQAQLLYQGTGSTGKPISNASVEKALEKASEKASEGPRKMKRAQKTRNVELEAPAGEGEGEEGSYEGEGEEEEPSQALIALQNGALKALSLLLSLARALLRVCCSGIKMVIGLLPTSLHLALFLSLLYALSEYVVTPLPNYVDFVGRLRYVVRCLAWTLVPAVLGYIVSGWKKAEGHRKFADDTFRLVAMLGLNSAVFSTYASAQCMHYVWVLHVLIATYSLGYWASLTYGGAFTRKSFRQPTVAILFLFMAWNFWNVLTQDLGWDDSQQVAPPPPASSGDRGLNYWQYATMCEMVERVFCTVEDGPRMYYQ